MIIEQLVRNSVAWLDSPAAHGVVVSTRARLARNISGFSFPPAAGEDDRKRLRQTLRSVFSDLKTVPDAVFVDLETIDAVDREVLKERRLISSELADRPEGSALVVAAEGRFAMMINEEDHLRLQSMVSGFHPEEVWQALDAVDTEIERRVEYAFSPELGYLTACPTNVGTGLRVSAMMHLPGLRLTEEVDSVVKGLNATGFEVRGLLGEGTAAYGNMFQVSNRASLGLSESDIVVSLKRMVNDLTEHEMNARARLIEEDSLRLFDQVARSYAIVEHAGLLSSSEALDLLSALRLGREMGLVRGVSDSLINQVMLLTQPGHLQKDAGRSLESYERDQVRASSVRNRLRGMRLRPGVSGAGSDRL